jgi:hypothetical protein
MTAVFQHLEMRAFALMLGNTQVQTLPTTDIINYHLFMIKDNLIIYVHSRIHIKPTAGGISL